MPLEVPFNSPFPWSTLARGTTYYPLQLGQAQTTGCNSWLWLLLAAGAGATAGYLLRDDRKKGARHGG